LAALRAGRRRVVTLQDGRPHDRRDHEHDQDRGDDHPAPNQPSLARTHFPSLRSEGKRQKAKGKGQKGGVASRLLIRTPAGHLPFAFCPLPFAFCLPAGLPFAFLFTSPLLPPPVAPPPATLPPRPTSAARHPAAPSPPRACPDR